jgi:hypothetical protein
MESYRKLIVLNHARVYHLYCICSKKPLYGLRVSFFMLAYKSWLALWLTHISQKLNNFYCVESKNKVAYTRERRKRNKNMRQGMNVT